ncbi:hypothetical protein C2E23DRAFT_503424 [Lenzites betulinus]|nr:hypothetical protein C2E23DRAFT_503424 [Lenzites betulinus]
MWDNGNLYFLALVSLNAVDIILAVCSINVQTGTGVDYVMILIDPTSSILNSHFLLDLYDTTARLRRGGASTSSFSLTPSSLNFAHPESADFSEFLAPFAGPLQHSALLELDEGPELLREEGFRGRWDELGALEGRLETESER